MIAPGAVGVDADRNVYVGIEYGGQPVASIARGAGQATIVPFHELTAVNALTVDPDGNIVIVGAADTITTYTPAGTIVRQRTTGFPARALVVRIAVSQADQRLYAAFDGGSIEAFRYLAPASPPALIFGSHLRGGVIAIGD